MKKVGRHVSMDKEIDNTFLNAKEIGCTSMQVFISSPRRWDVKRFNHEEKLKFISDLSRFNIEPVVAHMPYLPNLASPVREIHKRSVETLNAIATEASELEIEYVVLHLGSHMGEGRELGVGNFVNAINEVEDSLRGVTLLLENEAGQKNSIGSTPEELIDIFDKINSKKVGFCIDTCHIFAAGYDIGNVEVMEKIDKTIDIRNVHIFHLNDSKFELGSRLDRHDNIGKGKIGAERFRKFFGYKNVLSKPMILETPINGIDTKEELEGVKHLMDKSLND
ncbi:MAG: deoxyribonuclease IV [Candidatus Marsarchaeota archaeon]|jgi:deoxyribonuclease-4|nr:deoxyribonuclease IV [Candidatus Marsarchaeota archaeon]